MPKLSKKSKQRLESCAPKIQKIMNEAIKHFDFSILEGHRSEQKQNKAYNEGRSKLKYPDSKHNKYPSQAIDIAPYPINWEDRERFTFLAGFIQGIASQKGINIRWGGDWDRDTDLKDNKFDDLPHFELI